MKSLKTNLSYTFFCLISLIFTTSVSFAQKTISEIDPQKKFDEALELFTNEKFSAARQSFEQYLKQKIEHDPLKKIEAQYYIAYAATILFHDDAETLMLNFVEKYKHHPKASLAYFDLGNFYYQDGNLTEAIRYYEKSFQYKLEPSQENERSFKLAYAYFSKKQFKEALPHFNKVKKSKNEYQYPAFYYAGYIYYKEKDYDKAIENLIKASENEAYKKVTPINIATIYFEQKAYDKLIQYGENILQENSKNVKNIHFLLAETYYLKKDYASALKHYEIYSKNTNQLSPETHYNIAFAYYQNSQNEESVNHFKLIAHQNDSLGQYGSFYLGQIYLKQENERFALAALEKAKNDTFDIKIQEIATINYAKVCYNQSNFREVINTLENFTQRFPKSQYNNEAAKILSNAFLNTKNYQQVINYIEKLPNKTPDTELAYQKASFQQGVILFNQKEFYPALTYFKKSLEKNIDPTIQTQANFWAAETYTIGKKYKQAQKHYMEVLKKNLNLDQDLLNKTRYGIAYAYYNDKMYQKSLNHFKTFIANTNNTTYPVRYFDATIRLADCYYVTKQYDQALKNYDIIVQEKANDQDYAYLQQGIIAAILNNDEKAEIFFDQLIKKYPESKYITKAQLQKAQLYLDRSKYQQAKNQLSTIIQNYPQNPLIPHAYLKRAIASLNLNEYEEAKQDYILIIETYPAHNLAQNALVGLQEIFSIQGNPEAFEPYFKAFQKANPNNQTLSSIAFDNAIELYFNQKYDLAIQSFKEFIKKNQSNVLTFEATYYIAESFFRQPQYDSAKTYFEKVFIEKKAPQLNKAIHRLAEIEQKDQNYKKATYYYETLEKNAKNKKEAFYAWSGQMEIYFTLKEYKKAEQYAQKILDEGNISINAQSKATLFLGKTAFAQSEYDKAKPLFEQTLTIANDEFSAEAKYLLAKIAYLQKQYETSIQILYEFNTNFTAYPFWLGKAFLLLADNYIALEESFQAKATLQSIIEKSPEPQIVKEAKEKFQQLESSETTTNETDEEQ